MRFNAIMRIVNSVWKTQGDISALGHLMHYEPNGNIKSATINLYVKNSVAFSVESHEHNFHPDETIEILKLINENIRGVYECK